MMAMAWKTLGTGDSQVLLHPVGVTILRERGAWWVYQDSELVVQAPFDTPEAAQAWCAPLVAATAAPSRHEPTRGSIPTGDRAFGVWLATQRDRDPCDGVRRLADLCMEASVVWRDATTRDDCEDAIFSALASGPVRTGLGPDEIHASFRRAWGEWRQWLNRPDDPPSG